MRLKMIEKIDRMKRIGQERVVEEKENTREVGRKNRRGESAE
jgi:hypothetical protein